MMKQKNKKVFQNKFRLLCFLCLQFIFIFLSTGSHADQEKLKIFTVNYPLQYFAERIAGTQAAVVFPAPAEVDPAYWMPDTGTIANYQKADLILLNGAHYAKWVDKVSLPTAKTIDTSRKFKDQYIYSTEATTHSHGSEGAHAHESLAFTLWLDFNLAVQQAKAIEKALVRKRPMLKDTFEKNFMALEKDLMALDRELKVIATLKQNQPLVGSHPVYDYLAKGYALNLKSVHWEPNEPPTFQQWQNLKRTLTYHPAKWMVWEANPDQSTVIKLKSIEVKSLVFDPCGNAPKQGDFLTVMQLNIRNLKSALQ
jgi:zinc transport system substrate-binding protein